MKRLISIAMLALLLCSVAFAQDEAAKKKEAQTSAETWLALVDAGNYGQSWDEASTFFKSKVSKADWEKMLAQVRTPLGKSDSRTPKVPCTKPLYLRLPMENMSCSNTKLISQTPVRRWKRLLRCWIRMASGECRDTSSGQRSSRWYRELWLSKALLPEWCGAKTCTTRGFWNL